jgi:hypothetical protein
VRRQVTLLYPILFAVALVLGVAARATGQYRGVDLAQVMTVAVLATALVLALMVAAVRLFDRTARAAPLAAALTMLVVAWTFFYVPLQYAASAITYRGSRDIVLLPVGVLATIGLVAWLLRQTSERLTRVNAFMTRFGLVLVALVAAQVAMSGETPAAARRSALVRQLAEPLRVIDPTAAAARNTPKRDIYLIVLDGHPNARVVRDAMGYDIRPFEDSLRALGFTIPREMHSNYAQSILSIPSILNGEHLLQLAEDAGARNPSYALPRYLVENNRSARFLKQQGYKYVFFPSAWWTPTRHSPIADSEFNARPDFKLANEVRRTELRQAVLSSTLLRYLPDARIDTLFDFRSMRGIRDMPADTAPTFVFAHFLLPHVPYYLDAQCHAVPQPIFPKMEDADPEQQGPYLAQLRCVDHLVLDLVTTLLRDSRPAPVIIIVGDHGSRFAGPTFVDRPESASTALIRERFGAFGAFHLPAGGDSQFTGSVTLVNVMRNVLRYYFGADLPPRPDDQYISGTLPFLYYKVDSTGYIAR